MILWKNQIKGRNLYELLILKVKISLCVDKDAWTLQSTKHAHHLKLLSEVYFLSDHLSPRGEVAGEESRGPRGLSFRAPSY